MALLKKRATKKFGSSRTTTEEEQPVRIRPGSKRDADEEDQDQGREKPALKIKSKAKSTKPRSAVRALAKADNMKAELDEAEQQLLSKIPVAGPDEKEYLVEYLRMFRRLKRLIKQAYDNAYESGSSRDAYAICTLMSQQREVIADIRTVTDLSGQVQILIENLLQPFVRNIGQVMLDGYYQTRRLVMETTEKKETQFALQKLNELTTDQSRALQDLYEHATVQLNQILVGGPAEDQPTRKKKRRG